MSSEMSESVNPKQEKVAEHTSLWKSSEKLSYLTTQKTSFPDKSEVLKHRSLVKESYEDKLWFLGWEDYDILYRRRRLLAPLSVRPRKNIDGPPLVSTHTLDFNAAAEFTHVPTPQEQGRVAGLVTKSKGQGLSYGSEEFNQITQAHKVHNKRTMSIFEEQFRRSAIQTFRDDVPPAQLTPTQEQELIRNRIQAGLTIPIIRSR